MKITSAECLELFYQGIVQTDIKDDAIYLFIITVYRTHKMTDNYTVYGKRWAGKSNLNCPDLLLVGVP